MQSSHVAYGVVPFENSSNGSVVQLLDLLADREGKYADVKVCAEYYLRVHHCLLANTACEYGPILNVPQGVRQAGSFSGITKLYTHPQAWGQCAAFLAKHFKGVERQDVSSTSKAATVVAEDGSGTSAAIASRLAGEVHGLQVLSENIEDQGDNTTRFFIVRREEKNQDGVQLTASAVNGAREGIEYAMWKSLIRFSIDHGAPGALADTLSTFKRHGYNLTSIDTRPSRVRPWHYIFFVECEQTSEREETDTSIGAVITDLQKVTQSCEHLGRWKDELSRGG